MKNPFFRRFSRSSRQIFNTQKMKPVFKINIKKAILILLIIIVLYSLLSFLINLTRIKCVVCLMGDKPCEPIYQINTSEIKSQNLLKIDHEEIINQILNSNPSVERVTLRRDYPQTLIINLVNRQGIYLIVTPEQSLVVDDEGMALPVSNKNDAGELIPIETHESFAVGQKIVSPSILSAMGIINLLQNSGLRVMSASVQGVENINIKLMDSTFLMFDGMRNMEKQVDSVMMILNNPQLSGDKKISEIDVRFNDPIVK